MPIISNAKEAQNESFIILLDQANQSLSETWSIGYRNVEKLVIALKNNNITNAEKIYLTFYLANIIKHIHEANQFRRWVEGYIKRLPETPSPTE